jgi:hypothetical protein
VLAHVSPTYQLQCCSLKGHAEWWQGNDFDGLIAEEPTLISDDTLPLLASKYRVGKILARAQHF